MQHSCEVAVKFSEFLTQQKHVVKVLHPSLNQHPGHQYFKTNFQHGSPALMSFVMDREYNRDSLGLVFDSLKTFKMGYSWGGVNSLMIPIHISGSRPVSNRDYKGHTVVRVYVGLENIEDLFTDFENAFQKLT